MVKKVSKHKEIKGSDKCVTLNIYEILNISEKFDDLKNMETTSSESKVELEISGKGLVTALDFKTKVRSPKYKKARYDIGSVSEKNLSKIIKKFEKIEKLPYENKRPKHDYNESYFHLARDIAKCMMKSDNLIWYDHGGYTKMTALYSNVNITNESISNRTIVNEKLLQSCSMNENKSKRSIFNKTAQYVLYLTSEI